MVYDVRFMGEQKGDNDVNWIGFKFPNIINVKENSNIIYSKQ
jgi:hypothetical protein